MRLYNSITLQSKEYNSALPYPHGVQDTFLHEDFAKQLQEEILTIPKDEFDRYENPFESKYTLRNKHAFPPLLNLLFDALQSESFLTELSSIVGYPLQLDTERLYWGVHLYDAGDKLDIHTDAGIHPIVHKKKHCTVGIYLSKEYKESQGCHLEIWKGTSCLNNPVLEEKVVSIAPIFNRMILFTCTDKAWHGNPEPLQADGNTKRIFITISYLSDDLSLTNTYKKALFVKRPQDPTDAEKDRLRLLRANPETCTEVYRTTQGSDKESSMQ
jgi:Rps23 Pro-64 3,4-dihydroxylase Tpa1-like proline 4-hydroxylase